MLVKKKLDSHYPENPLCLTVKVEETCNHYCKHWKGHEDKIHECKCGYTWYFNEDLTNHMLVTVKTDLNRFYVTGKTNGSKKVLKFNLKDEEDCTVYNNVLFTVSGGRVVIKDLTGKMLVEEGNISVYKTRYYKDA